MSSLINGMRSLNVGTKLAFLVPLIMSLVFAIPAWFISVSTANFIEQQAVTEITTKIGGLLDLITASVSSFKTEADYALQLFAYQFPGQFSLDTAATIGIAGRATPALKNGDHAINLDFAQPDVFTQETGGVATVFVKQDDDFIRVTTSLKKENGERAVGTLLDRQHPAYQQLLNNQSYHGAATLFGRDYMTKYQPIRDKNGVIVGALFVGIDISARLKTLIKDKIKALKVGETGYYYILSNKPGKEYGQFVLHPTLEGQNALSLGDNTLSFIQKIMEQKRGVISYPWTNPAKGETQPREKMAAFDYAEGLNWIIVGGSYVDELKGEAYAKARQLALLGLFTVVVTSLFLYFAIHRLVSQPLGIATGAAEHLAEGDLRLALRHDRTDEMGRLLEAMNQIAEKLADMVTKISESANLMGHAIDEIADDHQQLTHHAEAQVAVLTETASTMEELTATVKQNADHARAADQLAASARQQAEQGGQVVEQAVIAMAEIQRSSHKVADIIGVIDDIAFQTNLLALNAAVEAARAGEQGRGFAVVAGEVRKLAQRSAEAAKEIKGLIQDSVTKVADGERFVNQSGVALNEIVRATQKVNGIVAEIAAANREQTSGIEQVSQAIARMDGMIQQNAALANQASESGDTVNTQARELGELMQFFKLESAR